MREDLRALLAPRSVALVGASGNPDRIGSRPLRYLQRDGWAGRIYPVNAGRASVLGLPAWPKLSDLPEVPDHVFILAPTEAVIPVVEECASIGVSIATILAGGFGEAGAGGEQRQRDLVRAAGDRGLRLLGPNAIGVVDTRTGLTLTANAAFAGGTPLPGSTLVASQSGSMIGALLSRARSRGTGFAALVSVGAELDLSVGEICSSTLDDDDIDSYSLFLETLSHANELRAFALGAAERGKPVLAYKLGRSRAASDLVVTHTGALAGDEDVAAAFFVDCGMARVDTIDGLIEGPLLAVRTPIRPGPARPRVGVLTATGGGAAMVVDQLGIRGIDAVQPSDALHGRLCDAVRYDLAQSRIVDLTLRGTASGPMAAALGALRSSDEFDLVVQVLGSSAATAPEDAVRPALDAPMDGPPIAVFLVPDAPDALAALVRQRIPAFRTPESCADAVSALLLRDMPRKLARPLPPSAGGPVWPSETMSDLWTFALLDRIGVPRASLTTVSPDDDIESLRLDYPVVLKALVTGLAHKTEAGVVEVGLADAGALQRALDVMAKRVQTADGGSGATFIVQPMITGVLEVLVGYVRDPQVGPLVVLAPGGIYADLFETRSIRLAPVDAPTARRMITEVPVVSAALDGFRGRQRGDVDALVSAIVAMSTLAAMPTVHEAEVNPLIVGAAGAVAVDALCRASASFPSSGSPWKGGHGAAVAGQSRDGMP